MEPLDMSQFAAVSSSNQQDYQVDMDRHRPNRYDSPGIPPPQVMSAPLHVHPAPLHVHAAPIPPRNNDHPLMAMNMVKAADMSRGSVEVHSTGHTGDQGGLLTGLTSPVVSTADIVSRGQAVLDAVQDTPSESHDDDDDDDEDDDDVDDEDEDGNKSADTMSSEKARHAITGRGVTLSMLMADGIIQHGSSTMSIDYLGQKFTADLLEDGSIRWKEANKMFSSPSAWAIHCKKIVNPLKKSGCGWASVRYKGKKLDSYKSSWLSKKRPLAMASMANNFTEEEDDECEEKLVPEIKRIKCEEESVEGDSVSTDSAAPSPMLHIKPEVKKRFSVKHSTLGRKSHMQDPNTLVECTPFAALGKIQPFSLSISTNCLLLMDFHSHLSSSEIVGYLGAKWDPGTQHLSLEQAFPCRCRLGDKNNAPAVENEIREKMEKQGLTLGGWYHSHPVFSPNPSLRDLEAQMEYQLQMKGPGESIQPCVSLIMSPYNYDSGRHEESEMKAVWVMAPPEHRPLDYGMPMRMCYDITEDQGLPQIVLSQMKKLVDFHQGETDFINFHDLYHHNTSYLAKLKASLSRKLPKDQQADKQLLNFLNTTLV